MLMKEPNYALKRQYIYINRLRHGQNGNGKSNNSRYRWNYTALGQGGHDGTVCLGIFLVSTLFQLLNVQKDDLRGGVRAHGSVGVPGDGRSSWPILYFCKIVSY